MLEESIITNTGKIHKSCNRAQRVHPHRGTSAESAQIVAVETRVRANVALPAESPEIEQVAFSDRSSATARQRHAAVKVALVEGLPSRAHVSRDFGQGSSLEVLATPRVAGANLYLTALGCGSTQPYWVPAAEKIAAEE